MLNTTKTWVPVCKLNDLPTNKAVDLQIANQRLVITHCGDDAKIFQGFCTHMLFPLAGSKIEGCVMTCGLHHSSFDVRDGSVQTWGDYPPVTGPELEAIRARRALRNYETKIEGGTVYIMWSAQSPESVQVRVKL